MITKLCQENEKDAPRSFCDVNILVVVMHLALKVIWTFFQDCECPQTPATQVKKRRVDVGQDEESNSNEGNLQVILQNWAID